MAPARTVAQLVKEAKRKKQNRVYYEQCFEITEPRNSGLLQSCEKNRFDQVTCEPFKNELLHYFGVNQDGDHFELTISIVSLFLETCPNKEEESNWRLANVKFTYSNRKSKRRYLYNCEQLVDYGEKQTSSRHEATNCYKIGSLSIELVQCFALTRIVLNGLVELEEEEEGEDLEIKRTTIPICLTISTHPTCDKFDFKNKFNQKYTSEIVSRSQNSAKSHEELLELVLADRIDQPFMFQGELEHLDGSNKEAAASYNKQSFVLWGAKTKHVFDGREELHALKEQPRENLFVWAESGNQLHLSRPCDELNLVSGMVHGTFDYASYLYDCSLSQAAEDGQQVKLRFDELSSFCDATTKHELKVRAYKQKEYCVKFESDFRCRTNQLPVKVTFDQFDGWALLFTIDLTNIVRSAQRKLWLVGIRETSSSLKLTSKLACERLLGGKGNSLVELSKLEPLIGFCNKATSSVSVPNGLIVSCVAFENWLQSDKLILKTIHKLDCVRRSLASQTINTNPLEDNYKTPGECVLLIREQCDRTCAILRQFPLPVELRRLIERELCKVFQRKSLASELDELTFAIRSSAVGEDSLETSAAGQMKTLLNVKRLDQICKAIVECWTSQFELEAVQYKSQNGLAFVLPMAVVVQEQINCHLAGVAATCNPLNGNKLQLELTANFGMGENVVAGRQTDTVRVNLPVGASQLGTPSEVEHLVEKLPADKERGCCLSSNQIVALANLLLKLRELNSIEQREVEWGITTTSESSASSSSSSSSDEQIEQFRVHLFQSRPLTNLNRLSACELDHELDCGFQSPLDVTSRANLGEVMPGAMCALNCTWLQPAWSTLDSRKPYEKNHTICQFEASSFGFYANMALLVPTNSAMLARFSRPEGTSESERKMARSAVNTMIGFTNDLNENSSPEKSERFKAGKQLPIMSCERRSFGFLLALDAGGLDLIQLDARRAFKKTVFAEDRKSVAEFCREFEACSLEHKQELLDELDSEIKLIFERLMGKPELLSKAWKVHMHATLLSMGFNVMCLSVLCKQPAYPPEQLDSSELLNDFSILMRGAAQTGGRQEQSERQVTESSDISKLLDKLIEALKAEGQLERAKQMSRKQLFDYLNKAGNDNDVQRQSGRLFRKFMQKNGHRAYKEFCLSTKTWADDSSHIISSLELRIKRQDDKQPAESKPAAGEVKLAPQGKQVACAAADKFREAQSKLVQAKFLLEKYALPRARKAILRREASKSFLIKVIHKYRRAFRHLAGLLCLAGKLPSVDLVFHLTIEELNTIVGGATAQQGGQTQDMARLLFKARRRMQRMRLYDQVTFPRPNLSFMEMFHSVREQTGFSAAARQNRPPSSDSSVAGLTSCGGRATGRACVVHSIDQMDQVQQNDILITYSIDISWSVYFFQLAGIVTEVGGIVSHGAVVAREYGIPTLCTAIGACSTFKTGQLVTLDAERGVCYLNETSAKEEAREEIATGQLSNNGVERTAGDGR